MIAVALSHRKSFFTGYRLPHACATCRESPETKIRWGCEIPTEEEQLWIPCMRCGGEDPDCPCCAGNGHEAIYRCPRVLVGPWEAECRLLHRHWPGLLPELGGLMDQPARYVEAMRILDTAEDLMRKLIQDEQEAEARRMANHGN